MAGPSSLDEAFQREKKSMINELVLYSFTLFG